MLTGLMLIIAVIAVAYAASTGRKDLEHELGKAPAEIVKKTDRFENPAEKRIHSGKGC